MNKMKRLLALTICMLLLVTSLPVTQLVFAGSDAGTETTDGLISFHETTFESVDDLIWNHSKTLSYAKPSIDEDGYYTFTETKTTGTGKNVVYGSNRYLGDVVISVDEDNRTELITDNFDGKYKFDINLEVLLKGMQVQLHLILK